MIRVMTYDFGTTSLKAAVVDHAGQIVADANESYPISQPASGWAEQDPRTLWEAAARAGIRARERAGLRPEQIDSVVFVAPWKGIIPVDARGEVLHDAIIWMDGRAETEAAELAVAAGRVSGTGQEYWPRLMWLRRHRPEVWARARWILGMAGYLRWRATGVASTEPSDDFARAPRHAAIMAAAGLSADLEKFPPSMPATAEVGPLTAEAAAHLGLAEGTPVLGGFGDLPAITIGAGPLVEGAAHLYFGTSSWFAVVTAPDAPVTAPLAFDIDERFSAALYPLQTGCLAYDWIVEQTYGAEKAHLHEEIQTLVNADVDAIEPGSDNLLATHWLNGELPPLATNARGAFLNLTTRHDRRHMVRAVMESLCYSHRSSIEQYEAASGRRLEAVTVVGGGASSDVWMRMLADVLQRTVIVPDHPRYVGTIGAHYCGIVHAGAAADLTSVSRAARRERSFAPRTEHRAVYDRMYGVYSRLYPALAGLFDELNGPRGHHP